MEYGSAEEMNSAIQYRVATQAQEKAAADAEAKALRDAQRAEQDAITKRANDAQAAAEAKAAKDAADAEAKLVANRGTQATRLQDAKNQIISQLYANTKLTGDQFLGDVESYYTTAKDKIPDGATNVGEYLDVNSIVNNISNNKLTGIRNAATTSANSLFAPGFENSYLADTADDPIINKILDESFATYTGQLDNAKKRGTLNDIGYGASRKALDDDRTKAAASLQSLGSSILASGRESIGAIGNEARSRAGSINFGETFDPMSYQTRASGAANDFLSTLEGRIRNSTDPSTFSDLQRLLNNGGSAQGPLGGGDVAFDESNRKRRSDQRGLGSTGAF
jgi:hypothetical protein